MALRISGEQLAVRPGDVDALLVEGDGLAPLGRSSEADAAFRQALAMQSQSAEARMGLGRLALDSDPAGAEALFLEVPARDPPSAKALIDLGIARDLQGRHAEAQAAWRRALGIEPNSPAAATNLALSLGLSEVGAERPMTGGGRLPR